MLLAAVKAHAGFHLQISRFFQMFFSQFAIEETFCLLPYRYFNEFLVLYPDFSGSRQIDLFEMFHLVRGLSHHSHQWIILTP